LPFHFRKNTVKNLFRFSCVVFVVHSRLPASFFRSIGGFLYLGLGTVFSLGHRILIFRVLRHCVSPAFLRALASSWIRVE
jgi:hypothetical protein